MMKPYGKSWEQFAKENLNNAGTIVKIVPSRYDEGGVFLIGDINAGRGVCDDCTAFREEQIVESYDDSLSIDIKKLSS